MKGIQFVTDDTGSFMPNEDPLDILLHGVRAWNEWRQANPYIQPILAGANLVGIDLSGANLSGAVLFRTVFNRTLLNRTDFSRAMLGWTIFGNVDLSTVRGLDTVEHKGPSTIGIDTIYRSGGNIPEVFLRGAGVPDTFIRLARSLVGQPIQFYTCFISYSSKDKGFCDRLYADLQSNGVRVWYFPEDARWGKPVWDEIDRSIERYDKLVVVCSKHSLQSGPVLREIERALQREDREGGNILFPVRIDNYLFEEWKHPRKADVLSKVAGDFQGWDEDVGKYDAAFGRFLEYLKRAN